MNLLIKNANIIDYNKNFIGDILIKDGFIEKIEKNIEIYCDEIIDLKEKIIMPGFIDLHSHFRDPGFPEKETLETGINAAIKGGYTTVNLMANTKPVCDNMDTIKYILKKAEEINKIDIYQTVSATKNLEGKDCSHLNNIIHPKVKFISDDGKGIESDEVLIEIFKKSKEKDMLLISHAEYSEIFKTDTREAENKMTFRDIDIAEKTNSKIHIAHVSTKEAIEYIIKAKNKNVKVTCEIMPHHISLTGEKIYRVNPPIREKEDINTIIEAIKNDYVDIIATDHAPHTFEDKKNGAPGISGIETSFSVCYTYLVKSNHISLSKLSQLMSQRPAEILKEKKGKIEKGYIADLIIVDIEEKYILKEEDIISKGKNTPFIGFELFGKVKTVIKNGNKIFEEV